MSSDSIDDGAESRYWSAFERLKSNTPIVVKPGTPVSQKSVALEAGSTDSAIKARRFPALVRAIQAVVLAAKNAQESKRQKARKARDGRRSLDQQLQDAKNQRDAAQAERLVWLNKVLDQAEQIKELTAQCKEAGLLPNSPLDFSAALAKRTDSKSRPPEEPIGE